LKKFEASQGKGPKGSPEAPEDKISRNAIAALSALVDQVKARLAEIGTEL
jgi:hypothetical protein